MIVENIANNTLEQARFWCKLGLLRKLIHLKLAVNESEFIHKIFEEMENKIMKNKDRWTRLEDK